MKLVTRTWPALSIALLALATLALSTGCRGNRSKEPPVHPNQNMDFAQSYEAQEENPWFPDKRAMRPRVEGTQPRSMAGAANDGFLQTDTHLYEGRGSNGRLVDALPASIPLTQDLLKRGQERYDVFCVPCHDNTGAGNGMVMQRGWPNKPPSYHTARLRALPLGHFYDVITNGRGTMYGYGSAIHDVNDRWAIAAYVRALQLSQGATLADVPADVAKSKEWLK